jgi:hypothetical protein
MSVRIRQRGLVLDRPGLGCCKHPAGAALRGVGTEIQDVLTAARKDVRTDHGADDDIDGAGASASLER